MSTGVYVDSIEVASPVRHAPQKGFRFIERRIPPDLIQELSGQPVTAPSLTAVELATFEFTDPIDIALRRRKVSLATMREALDLTPHRRGHWVANLQTLAGGDTYYLDIGFREERLASEIDGRLHETDVDVFETDRTRQNALVLDGWMVLRFTWYLLTHEPGYVIATTREALAQRRTNGGLSGSLKRDTPRLAS